MYIKLPETRLILLAFISVLVAIVLIEIFLRISKVFIPPPHLTQKSAIYGFEHIPNAKAVYKSLEFQTDISINSHGLRDYEISEEKPKGLKRIAVVGDSFVEGLQVHLDRTIPKKLEQGLKDNNYQVINFGVSGFGIEQKYLFIREKVLKYNPDIIILFLSTNDLDDIKNNGLVSTANGTIKFKYKPMDKRVEFLKSHLRKSYLANFLFLINLKKTNAEKNLPMEHRLYQGIVDDEVQNYLDLTKQLLLESRKVSELNRSEFILVIGADRIQVNQNYENNFKTQYNLTKTQTDFFNNYFSQFAKDNSIVYLDLSPVLRKEIKEARDVYFKSDGHWNEHGHEFIAKHLRELIIESNRQR